MTTRRIGRFIAAAALAVSAPLLVNAAPADGAGGPGGFPPPHHRHGGPGMHHHGGPGMGFEHSPRILRGIKLDEAQQDQVFKIMHGRAPALRDAFKEARHARKALRELVASGNFDEAKARALTERSGRAIAQAELLKATSDAEILAVLTPAQKAEWLARKDHRPGMGKPGEWRRPGEPRQPGAPAAPAAPAAQPGVLAPATAAPAR